MLARRDSVRATERRTGDLTPAAPDPGAPTADRAGIPRGTGFVVLDEKRVGFGLRLVVGFGWVIVRPSGPYSFSTLTLASAADFYT